MNRFPLVIATVCSMGLLALPADSFSPGPPRPIPSGVDGVCSDGQPPSDPNQSCGANFNPCNPGAVCLAAPASVIPGVSVRAALVLIVDEDVTGWTGGADASSTRLDDARLTLLIEFENGGKPFAVADTFKLDRGCILADDESSLCVPTWNEPLTEAHLIARAGAFQDLSLQWAAVNPQMSNAILNALLTPDQRTQFPNARPLLEVVDGVASADELSSGLSAAGAAKLDQSDHAGSDPLASVRRLKATIRVAK